WIVKPGGTGRPAFVISARPAPLPPRTSFILPFPSALPPPKKYTNLTSGLLLVLTSTALSGRVVVAINKSFTVSGILGFFAFSHDLGEVRDRGKFFKQCLEKRETVGADTRIFDHDHHHVEELIDGGTKLRNFEQSLFVLAGRTQGLYLGGGPGQLIRQLFLSFVLQN